MLQQLTAVVLVLGILVAALWLLRMKPRTSVGFFHRRRTDVLESLGSLALTGQHSLHVVRAGKKILVVGVCPSSLTVVRELEDGVVHEDGT